MKNILQYSHWLTLLAGGVGMLMMVWLRAGGPDERGLYPIAHPAWFLLWFLTLAVLVGLWLVTRHAGAKQGYRSNFTTSLPAAVGYVLGGTGMLITAIRMLAQMETLLVLAGAAGIVGGVCLLFGAFLRLTGRQTLPIVHWSPCLFFMLELFSLGKSLGAEPEMCRYLFAFLSALAMLPACYWRWSFDVDLGNRQKCLFWCLCAAYFQLVAAVGSQDWLPHLSTAAWLLTSLPKLKYSPKRLRPAPVDEVAEQPAAPAFPIENVVADVASHTPPVADVDAILEQILKEFGDDPLQ